MLALGMLTPLAAAALVSVMAMAIVKVHGSNGSWNTNGGYEFNVALMAAAIALGLAGPGALALASLPFGFLEPAPAFVVSLAIGLVGVVFGWLMSETRTRVEQCAV